MRVIAEAIVGYHSLILISNVAFQNILYYTFISFT